MRRKFSPVQSLYVPILHGAHCTPPRSSRPVAQTHWGLPAASSWRTKLAWHTHSLTFVAAVPLVVERSGQRKQAVWLAAFVVGL